MNTPQFRASFTPDHVVFRLHGDSVTMKLEGADSAVQLEGIRKQVGTVNFLLGSDESQWAAEAPTYQGIAYRALYPGIDLTYGASGSRIKSEFRVAAHADPRRIRWTYADADAVSIEPGGALLIATSTARMREEAPEIYQESASGRVRVSGRYRLLGLRTVGFEIDSYDPSQPLIIDPSISYATYLGGSGMSAVTGLAIDTSSNIYLTGWTEAYNFPIAGAVQAGNAGGVDAFVAKLSADGSTLLYATYVGGNSSDSAAGIAVDAAGEAYVTGYTMSSNFPLLLPVRSTLGGGTDAFLFKLNAAGSHLLFSTYFGGSGWDSATAIALDSAGNPCIVGDTQSSDFPVLKAVQSAFGGQTDAFAAKFTSAGALSFSTFLGGSAAEHAGGVAVDTAGNLYIGGSTSSVNFPVVNAFQPSNAGGESGFLTKLASSGSSLSYSTYIGGSGGTMQQVNGVAVDAAGNAYLAGVTNSSSFPVTSGAIRTTYNGMQDAFASKVSSAGALVYSGYLGGSTSNWANAIAIDLSGDAYVVGYTSSVDYPMVNALQASFGGFYDAFLSEIDAAGSALTLSTYYGGSGPDIANAVTLDSAGNIYVAGETASSDFPLVHPYQSVYSGLGTGFALRINAALAAATNPTPASGATGIAASPVLSWTESGATSFDVYLGTSPSPGYVTTTSTASYSPSALSAGQTYYWMVVSKNGTVTANSAVWSFTVQGSCTYSISPQSASVASGSGSGSVNVTSSAGCGWTSSSNASWLTVTSGGSGTGSGSVSYSFSANSTGGSRSGTLTIAGLAFNVTQQAAGSCSYSINPTSVTQAFAAGTATVSVTAPAGCAWTASSNASWVTITSGSSGSGAGTVGYSVTRNSVMNVRSGTLTIAGLSFAITQGGAPVPDFDGNGTPDITWQNNTTEQVTVWYMGGSGGTTNIGWTYLDPVGEPGWTLVGAADFNGDGHPDLVWSNNSTRQVLAWYMTGSNGATKSSTAYLEPSDVPGWAVVALGDFNNDGVPDMVWQNDSTRQLTVWYMGGSGGATNLGYAWLNSNSNVGWHVAAVADFNLDGHPDLLWQNDTTGQLQVWFMGGSNGATFLSSASVTISGMSGWNVVGAGDFNQDGHPDIIWQSSTTGQIEVTYMSGAQGIVPLSTAWLCTETVPGWTAK